MWPFEKKKDKNYYCPKCSESMGKYATINFNIGKNHIICGKCKIIWRWEFKEFKVVDIQGYNKFDHQPI